MLLAAGDIVPLVRGHQCFIAGVFKELPMSPNSRHPAAFQKRDPVGHCNSGQTVGHHKHGHARGLVPTGAVAQAAQDLGLHHRIDRRRCVIEHQHPRATHECPSQGDALALTATQGYAPFAHHGVEAAGQLFDEAARPCALKHLPQLVVVEVTPQRHVVAQRGGKQKALLKHQGNR